MFRQLFPVNKGMEVFARHVPPGKDFFILERILKRKEVNFIGLHKET